MNEDKFKEILGKYKPANDNSGEKTVETSKFSVQLQNIKDVNNIIIGENISVSDTSCKKENPN
ncbi:MAG: hypothetical protein BWY78_00512 [Alphaproteobacteria bacterium ADurb.Bin438]|nr:MAG: hypothetical protein BWY78_00512 [Alphaproteobacteria bacterium ADurb.Bin438]